MTSYNAPTRTPVFWLAMTFLSASASAQDVPPDTADECRQPTFATATWESTGDTNVMRVQTTPGDRVTVTATALLAELRHTWHDGDFIADENGDLTLSLAVPEGAWLHDAARDYVTDLVVTISVDEIKALRAPKSFLSWPDDLSSPPVIWTQDQQAALAPNGVFRLDLRAGAEDQRERMMPNLDIVLSATSPINDTGLSR